MENMENIEIFNDIPGYEGLYQVSNLGRVKSLIKYKGTIERILRPGICTSGYYMVILSKNKKLKTISVHKLVSIVFLGHEPDGHRIVIDHINGDRLDNRVENLQFITQRQNTVKSLLLNENLSSKYTGVTWHKINKNGK